MKEVFVVLEFGEDTRNAVSYPHVGVMYVFDKRPDADAYCQKSGTNRKVLKCYLYRGGVNE
jgi:hypothetical protein